MYASRNLGCDIRGYIPSAKAKGFYALYYKNLFSKEKSMRIVVKPNKKRIRENNNRKKLTEGTSNFWSMENFPLLIFGYYPDIEEEVYRRAKETLPDDFDGEVTETKEYEKAWDEINYCVLDKEEVDDLKSDLDDFNYKMYHDDRYDTYEDEEVKLEVKPGYYEANQIYVPDEKYLSDW